jgi:predicted permease
MSFWRRRTDADFSSELRAHIDLETDRLIEQGLTPEDARAAAHRTFGNVARAQERFHESTRWIWIEQFGQDLRYASRAMRQSPAFVATTVLTLAGGLGLLTVAFTIFNAYVLRPYAVRDPQDLHVIRWQARGGAGGSGFGWSDYDELNRRSDLFTAVVGEHTRFVSSNGRPVMTGIVSLNYFDALGPAMRLGRGLSPIDATGVGNAAVITEPAWARLFDRDPSILGRELDLNGHSYTVVGVLGPQFVGLSDEPKDVFVPATPDWRAPRRAGGPDVRETEVFARLRRDRTRVQAEDALLPLMTTFISNQEQVRAEVLPQPSPNSLSVTLVAVLSPVFAAFVLVLVTACANVSNVMLARAIARHREIAVRLSIGASRGRVIRQMLTEGLVIAGISGLAALALAALGIQVVTSAFVSTLPPSVAQIVRLAPMTIDTRVFVFALAVATSTTMIFALLPALQSSRVSLTDAVRGQGSVGRRGSRLRNALVVCQVTVAIVLVITAVTLSHNGAALSALDVGFQTQGLLSIHARGPHDELIRPLTEALRVEPRVAEVAITSGNPLFNGLRTVSAGPVGGPALRTRVTFASPEFFPIMRLPITRGRAFTADEARASARVAIVSAAAARTFWPGQDPVGKTMVIEPANGRSVAELPNYPEVTVIGTTPDIVAGLILQGQDRGRIYLPITADSPETVAILLRGRSDRDLTAAAFREIFRRVVPDPEVFEVMPLEEIRSLQVYPVMSAGWVAMLLGAVALTLSVSGLYGALAYALSQRRKEIGIRMALGATAGAVVWMVVRQSMRLAGVGAVIGVALTFGVFKVLSSFARTQTLSFIDIGAFATGLILVAVATMFAAYEPARRATGVDPSQTLRADA